MTPATKRLQLLAVAKIHGMDKMPPAVLNTLSDDQLRAMLTAANVDHSHISASGAECSAGGGGAPRRASATTTTSASDAAASTTTTTGKRPAPLKKKNETVKATLVALGDDDTDDSGDEGTNGKRCKKTRDGISADDMECEEAAANADANPLLCAANAKGLIDDSAKVQIAMARCLP